MTSTTSTPQHTEDFTIPRRPGWGEGITVSIACDPSAPYGVKLGIAVRVAVMVGSDLRGSDLRGSNLSYSDLSYSDLRGSDLSGEKITRVLASVNRLDGYTFHAFEMEAGGVKISAGCRWFTVAEFRAHILAEYPDTDKARETGDILDFIEARCRSLGVSLEVGQ